MLSENIRTFRGKKRKIKLYCFGYQLRFCSLTRMKFKCQAIESFEEHILTNATGMRRCCKCQRAENNKLIIQTHMQS